MSWEFRADGHFEGDDAEAKMNDLHRRFTELVNSIKTSNLDSPNAVSSATFNGQNAIGATAPAVGQTVAPAPTEAEEVPESTQKKGR